MINLLSMNNGGQCERAEDEYNKLLKIINFRFPHKYKNIGLLVAGLILIFLIGYKFFGSNLLIVKDLLRTLMLLFLLIASLSKDTLEDEYVNHIRYQSYVLAFICATIYAVGIPIVAFLMDVLITKITIDGNVNFHEVSAFEVMFILLCFQLLFFETLKRLGRA